MKLSVYLPERAALVESALKSIVPPADCYPRPIHEAIAYVLFNGGKRLRPVLVLAACEAAGGAAELALEAACAVEMAHTYSLVHDDLPAMDDDDYRRGRLTCHRVYGEATAILVGDALLAEAFRVLAAEGAGKLGSAVRLQMVAELAEAVGSRGLVGGQVVDLQSEGKEIDRHTLEFMHRNKTARLFEAAVRLGVLSAGGSRHLWDTLSAYALHLGMAFQIWDDILDVEGESILMGKESGHDRLRDKATYVSLLGRQEAGEQARKHRDDAIGNIMALGDAGTVLRELADYAISRKA